VRPGPIATFMSLMTKKGVASLAALALYLLVILLVNYHAPVYRRFSSLPTAYVRYERAEVLSVEDESLSRDAASGLDLGYEDVRLRLLSGEHRGEVVAVKNTLSYSNNVRARVGSEVIACVDTADRSTYDVWIYGYSRGPFLYLFCGLFMAALCVIGGRRGVRSVLGIAFTLTGIAFVFIPLLYRGVSPAIAASGLVAVTLCVSLVLLGGATAKTLAAILGTLAGVTVSAIALAAALHFTHLSGFSTGEADALVQIGGATHMKVGELLFAGILISSLGAIIDVAISIASSVNEVHARNRALTTRELFRSGMNVGRDMMGAMANTLIIAFTGTSLNVLVLLYSMSVTYLQLMNTNLIGIYVVQAISGAIAIVFTVPLVSFVASRLIPALGRGVNEDLTLSSAA